MTQLTKILGNVALIVIIALSLMALMCCCTLNATILALLGG